MAKTGKFAARPCVCKGTSMSVPTLRSSTRAVTRSSRFSMPTTSSARGAWRGAPLRHRRGVGGDRRGRRRSRHLLSGQVDVYRYDAPASASIFSRSARAPSSASWPSSPAGRRSAMPSPASRSKALIFSPDRMRALLIAEAELGERLMRALILRRTQMLQDGVGGPGDRRPLRKSDVMRLEGFLARNGTPRMHARSRNRPGSQALIDRFHVDPGRLPIVICPGGEVLRNPSEDELARCIGLVGPIDPEHLYDIAIVGAGRPALPLRFTRRRRDFPFWCWIAARSAVRPAHRRASRIISAFRPASAAWR